MIRKQFQSKKNYFNFGGIFFCTMILFGCIPFIPNPTPTATNMIITKFCRLLSCYNMLIVTLSGAAPKDYSIEATAADGTFLSVHCVDNKNQPPQIPFDWNNPRCEENERVVFPNFTPDSLMITYISGSIRLEKTFTPLYQINYPNGPDCEPSCQYADLIFTIK